MGWRADPKQVGANASVALLSVGAATVIFVAQPTFDIFGVRTILIGESETICPLYPSTFADETFRRLDL